MKKVVFFIILFLSFNSFVFAQEIILTNKIIELEEIKGYGLQGFTTTDKYLFAVLVGENDSKSIIKVFDLKTYEEIKEIKGSSLGHANDVTFNSKNNRIYILASSGSSKMFEFDAEQFSYIQTIDLGMPARSITYIDDEDRYAIRLITSGFLTDSSFIFEKFPFILGMNAEYDVGRQGWAYYNKFIYYANWSWVRRGGTGDNTIIIYDLNGNRIDKLVTDSSTGEIEDIAFYNSKMILGFNGYDHKIKFYLEDIPPIEQKEEALTIEQDDIKKTDNNGYYIFILCVLIIFVPFIYYFIRKKTSK